MVNTKQYILLGIGVFGAVLFTSYVPSTMKVMSPQSPINVNYSGSKESSMVLENIPGLDIGALTIARQKGLF